MAPTTRSTAARSTPAASTATKKKTTSKKGKATASGTVKKQSAKKIAKEPEKTTAIRSLKHSKLPNIRSPSTATTTGQQRYLVPVAYTPTGNEYQPSPMVNKHGIFGFPQPGAFTPTDKKALNWEEKPKRGRSPTRYEIERFIGPDGRPLHELHSKFTRQIRHHGQLFWEICLGIAYIDKRKRPFHVFLRDVVEETTPQQDILGNERDSKAPVAGPYVPEPTAKKSSFAEGKSKSKDYRWEPSRGLKFPNQITIEQAALRGENTFGSIPFWSPVPARTPDGYVADIDTPRTPTPTPFAPTPSHKDQEKATSPGLSNPYKIIVAAKSRRDANRIVKRQQLVQRGCTELKGLVQTLKERLIHFEALFDRCAEGVDWETAELDVPQVKEKRLRFAE